MKIGICGAKADKVVLNPRLLYIGVDRGTEILLKNGIRPIHVVGDFDSLGNRDILTGFDLTVLPEVKDTTDTEEALIWAINEGYDEIDIYGVTGGRLDHFLAAVCLLEKYAELKIRIIDQQNIIRLLRAGDHRIEAAKKYFSLFSLDCCQLSIRNAKYELNNYQLVKNDPLCISNEFLTGPVKITNSANLILVLSND